MGYCRDLDEVSIFLCFLHDEVRCIGGSGLGRKPDEALDGLYTAVIVTRTLRGATHPKSAITSIVVILRVCLSML